MNIIIDAMGSDRGPEAVVEGCKKALDNVKSTLTLVGNQEEIEAACEKFQLPYERVQIVHVPEVISGEENPVEAIRNKKNSSMYVALDMLRHGQGDGVISGGNTGALICGTTLLVKRCKHVRRVALAPMLPGLNGGYLLLDAGANVECSAAFLKQFAMMGSIYMEKVMDCPSPVVKLINNGTEEGKGLPFIREAHAMLKESPLNYGGYIEARELPLNGADVVVCDGFTGNVVLKSIEGMGLSFVQMLKGLFMQNMKGKLAAGLIYKGLGDLKKSMDYTEYGGAPLLGAQKPVIKAHGSANANAFYHTIRQAEKVIENRVCETVQQYAARFAETDEER